MRRLRLLAQPRPEGPPAPPFRLFVREAASLPWLIPGVGGPLKVGKAVRPREVMALPGFLAHPATMHRLERTLRLAGHHVHRWGFGANFGPTQAKLQALARRVEAIASQADGKVCLVGWSLGGLFAREVAKLVPGSVAGVITMGSPFSGCRRANNAWRLYQAVAGHDVDSPPIDGDLSEKPLVPTVALWSPRDGIVAPRSACGRPGERDASVPLRCSHLGFASDPAAIGEVLRQLDRLGDG